MYKIPIWNIIMKNNTKLQIKSDLIIFWSQ